MKYSDSAIILLNEYVLEKNNSIELYIPAKLTIEEKESTLVSFKEGVKDTLTFKINGLEIDVSMIWIG